VVNDQRSRMSVGLCLSLRKEWRKEDELH